MTCLQDYCKNQHKSSRFFYFIYSYMSVFVLILFFKNSSAAAAWVSEGLFLCATRLIPSLFPFMVLSSLMVSSGAGAGIFKLASKPFGALFGIGEHGTAALILGWLCGFPVGAKCAYELLRDQRITQWEYKTILCTSSTPSPAFLIGTLGKGMLGNASHGILLYAVSLLTSSLIGVFMHALHREDSPVASARLAQSAECSFAVSLTHSIAEAGLGMLNVCAFVVFFSAFLGVLEGVLQGIAISDISMSVLFCFFEITTGLSRIASLPLSQPLPLCALAVGWSGLSVHFQTMSICSKAHLPFSPYILTQAIKGIMCFALTWLLSLVFSV